MQINNVATSYDHAQYFDMLEDSHIDRVLNINNLTLTRMCKIVIPGMLAKKKGIIINVGSAAGQIPMGDPFYTVYSSSKAYVDYFSKSLGIEYESRGIIVEVSFASEPTSGPTFAFSLLTASSCLSHFRITSRILSPPR